MIPPLRPNGVLPPGIHVARHNDFERIFVTSFPHSRTRRRIYQGYQRYLADLSRFDIATHQWLDGSYVTANPHPQDLDLVTHIDGFGRDSLVGSLRIIAERLFSGEDAKPYYECHAFAVAYYPTEYPELHDVYREQWEYWREWFGQTRLGEPKGIIEIWLGNLASATRSLLVEF